jgi:hypothetical protein
MLLDVLASVPASADVVGLYVVASNGAVPVDTIRMLVSTLGVGSAKALIIAEPPNAIEAMSNVVQNIFVVLLMLLSVDLILLFICVNISYIYLNVFIFFVVLLSI